MERDVGSAHSKRRGDSGKTSESQFSRALVLGENMRSLTLGLIRARLVRSMDRHCRRWLGPIDLNECVGRESQRVRRTGGEFSIVLFGIESWRRDDDVTKIRQFTRLLDRRARQTDLLGWLEPNLLCAVLPSTGTDGAVRFVEDILSLLVKTNAAIAAGNNRRTLQPAFRVHTYPSMWFTEGFDESILNDSAPCESTKRPQARAGRIVSVGFSGPDDEDMAAEGLKAV